VTVPDGGERQIPLTLMTVSAPLRDRPNFSGAQVTTIPDVRAEGPFTADEGGLEEAAQRAGPVRDGRVRLRFVLSPDGCDNDGLHRVIVARRSSENGTIGERYFARLRIAQATDSCIAPAATATAM
jgi:hypothetical protein